MKMRPVRAEMFLHTYLLTYLLTPWYRVLLEKLTGLRLVKKNVLTYITLHTYIYYAHIYIHTYIHYIYYIHYTHTHTKMEDVFSHKLFKFV